MTVLSLVRTQLVAPLMFIMSNYSNTTFAKILMLHLMQNNIIFCVVKSLLALFTNASALVPGSLLDFGLMLSSEIGSCYQ